eukprot:gnl/MRDRNA2_/MRDRNA2_80490_c0_seq2.p1 gnl/MRDRNA2_/MRDRNA2_80490_c0~~gnl/MRDRNA2_/MRDRNA2_80490_c0_seq2.p1  ORF type:complete len:241 (+),score=31.09 gnl/MRDRNA2_/MRDRNA2_80490_c0_seq2:66-788(+)
MGVTQGVSCRCQTDKLIIVRHKLDTEITVGVDIDDTIVQTVNDFRDWLDAENGGPLWFTWLEYRNEMQNQFSHWRQRFMQSGLVDEVLPVPGARKGLRNLKVAGFRLEVVTARTESMVDATMALIDDLFPDTFSNLHFCGGPPKVTKGATCKRHGINVLIDDALENLEDAAQHDVRVILFNHEGTYGEPEDAPCHVTQLKSWEDISECLIMEYCQGVQKGECKNTPSEHEDYACENWCER